MTSKTDPSDSDLAPAEWAHLLGGHIAPVRPAPDRQQGLSRRLQERVALSAAAHQHLLTVRAKHGVWQTLKPGIRFKLLWQSDQGNSVLIELAPGTALPEHRHQWLEEGLILRGGLQIDGLELGVADYHAAPAGSHHGRIQSRQGALAYLRGTSLGHPPSVALEVLGGLLPFGDRLAHTVFAADGQGWQTIADGVSQKILQADQRLSSALFRLAPGAAVMAHGHPLPEECMMLSGEVFLGDILLREGDYQLAPAGISHGEVYSDVGALLFRRGAVA